MEELIKAALEQFIAWESCQESIYLNYGCDFFGCNKICDAINQNVHDLIWYNIARNIHSCDSIVTLLEVF